jgi:hypothetical protein
MNPSSDAARDEGVVAIVPRFGLVAAPQAEPARPRLPTFGCDAVIFRFCPLR